MQEISILPGRVRLKHHKLHKNKLLAKYMEIYLDHLHGVISSKANPYTGTILVYFDNTKVQYATLKEKIASILSGGLAKNTTPDDVQKYLTYNKVINRQKKARNALMFYSLLLLVLKIKHPLIGKFSYSRNIKILQLAALAVIIGGYPALKQIYYKVTKNVSTDSDMLLNMIAMILTITRESSDGVLLLWLKAFNDYIHASANVKSQSLLNKSMGMPKIFEKQDTNIAKLKIYQEVQSYSEKVTFASIGLAAFNYLLFRNIFNGLSIMLALCPMGAQIALSTAVQQHIALLNKHNILLQNPNNFENTAKVNQIVFDINGTLTAADGQIRDKSVETIAGLKQLGIKNIAITTGSHREKAEQVAKQLGIKEVYYNCSPEDKEKIITNYKKDKTVLMVGDGVNDTAAMQEAHVSVSFANSVCDRVKLNSDCIIFDDEVYKLVDFIYLSQKSYDLTIQALAMTKYYNYALAAVAFFHYLNPFAAKTLNTINSVLVLLTNQRISRLQIK
ncbi:MAG: HAD-IC family P-type ATPase [Bacillota bacterium]|nr:HAD-IC family P-type ATPase [Bacillota bacterium]